MEHQACRPLADGQENGNNAGPSRAALALVARKYLKLRRLRDDHAAGLFADPAWDMLLDLYCAAIEGKRVSVSSACIASAAPTSTAIRYIEQMQREGLIMRRGDPHDRRRVLITIASRGEAMVAVFLRGLWDVGRGPSP